MTSFLFHTGTKNTGSSYLQTLCALRRKELSRKGIGFGRDLAYTERCKVTAEVAVGNGRDVSKPVNKFGTSTLRVSLDEPQITQHAIQGLQALNWHGMFNMDRICDEHRTAYLIDINERLNGSVAVPFEAGMDLPWIWYQVSAGMEDIDAQDARAGVKVRWILGYGIALVEHLVAGEIRAAPRILLPILGCRHDGFVWHDRLPLFGQGLDYLAKLIPARRVGQADDEKDGGVAHAGVASETVHEPHRRECKVLNGPWQAHHWSRARGPPAYLPWTVSILTKWVSDPASLFSGNLEHAGKAQERRIRQGFAQPRIRTQGVS